MEIANSLDVVLQLFLSICFNSDYLVPYYSNNCYLTCYDSDLDKRSVWEKDAEALIEEAISRISNERYREIIILLRKYPDASHKELAQKLGISETNFGARLNRAREQFEEVYSNLIKDNINI